MAIASPYCTKAEIRTRSAVISTTNMSDTVLDSIIAASDKEIKGLTTTFLDWSKIEALTAIPETLNTFSIYKTMENAFRRLYDDRVVRDDNPITMWTEKFNNLLEQLKNGEIKLYDTADYGMSATKTSSNKFFVMGNKSGVNPDYVASDT